MKSVGIDIGTFAVDVVEIESTSKGFSISGFKEFKLSQSPGADHEIEIIEILREIAKIYDPQTTRFVFGVHQDFVSLKHKYFPFKERIKILKSLPFELEDEIPLNTDDVIFDARILSYRGNFSEVLAVACPKEEVERILNLALDSGVEPDIISVESLAFANIFEEWHLPPPNLPPLERLEMDEDEDELDDEEHVKEPPEPTNLVLHIGHQRTLICVLKDKQLIHARTILWGGRDVAEKLSANYNVSVAEAIEMLPTKSFLLMTSVGATQQQIQLSQVIADSVNELSKEVKRMVVDLETSYNIKVQFVDIMGGTSHVKNLGPYLTQRLELPVNHFNHFDVYKNIKIPRTPEIEASSPIAIGLAIEGLKKATNPAINLRKNEFAKKNRSFEKTWARWGYAIQLSIALFFLFIAFGFIRGSIASDLSFKAEDNLEDVARKVAKLPKNRARARFIKRHIKEQESKIKTAQSLAKVKDLNSAVSIMSRISQVLPQPRRGFGNKATPLYEIRKLNVDYDRVEIEGVALSAGVDQQILQSLKNVSSNKKVTSKRSLLKVKPGERSFAYTFKVKRGL